MAAASPTSVMPPSSFKEDVKSVGYWFYNLVGPRRAAWPGQRANPTMR